jgi:aminoglycoside phosphotransferase (APT) family kinase protein
MGAVVACATCGTQLRENARFCDPHPGNCYFANGFAGLLDWQTARRGHPMRDVAYFIVTGMTTLDRQANERGLLDVYRRPLAASSGPELAQDDIWHRYRKAAAHSYVAACAAAGMGGLQSDDVAYAGLESAISALDDLETVALLRSSI